MDQEYTEWLEQELLWACKFIIGEFGDEGLKQAWRAINDLRKLGYQPGYPPQTLAGESE